MRTEAPTYYSMTKGLCRHCKESVDAKTFFQGGKVYLSKECSKHGRQDVLVSSSQEWYLDALSFLAPHKPPKRVMKPVSEKGCPFDCGACSSHQQKVYLPVVPITSACNLNCPICYTVNKNDGAYQMSKEELGKILEHLVHDHEELDIINFTGGEPTLNPLLPEFLEMCKAAGIKRATISTNGIKLRDEAFVRKLAALDARIVLSLDTFNVETDKIMLGANTIKYKLEVLDLLEKHDVCTTILPAVAAGLNDKDVPKLFDLVLSKKNILSLELHTLTFTGQGGVGFDRKARITTSDLHKILETHTAGKIEWRDFVPSPLAHSHCYSICYLLLLDDGGYVPFAKLFGRQAVYDLLSHSLYIEPRDDFEQAMRELMDDLWAGTKQVPESEAVLKTVKRLIKEMFPRDGRITLDERRKIAERSSKAVYIHSHMDEENFDVSRIMKCSVGVPMPDGTNIPTCSYNVLYREKDTRFADKRAVDKMHAASAHEHRPSP